MRKLTALLFTFSYLLLSLFFASSAYAQAPTATPIQQPATPTPAQNIVQPTRAPHKSVANCDMCGYCLGVEKIPGNWQNCVKCLYPGAAGQSGGDADPASKATLTNESGLIPTPDPNHYYTPFGCVSTHPGEFTAQMSSFFFSIIGGIAFLFFLYGSAVIATARSDPGRLNQGKRILIGSVVGLIFALMSVFIIRFIAAGLGLPGIN